MTLSVLTLNLHSYQEGKTDGASTAECIRDHAPLFDRIGEAIRALDVDVICFQEAAEHRSEPLTKPYGQAESNSARLIHERIGDAYTLVQDWSHYAWDTWREGCAVLSRFPIVRTESRYVTRRHDKDWWKSRNIQLVQVDVPALGMVNIFSVHTGWWDDADEPFSEQFDALSAWVNEAGEGVQASLLCGDFNVASLSEGYEYMMRDGAFVDAYLAANPGGMHDATIGASADGWVGREGAGQRIDYVLMKRGGMLKVRSAERVFTDGDYGRVSDHVGVVVRFGW